MTWTRRPVAAPRSVTQLLPVTFPWPWYWTGTLVDDLIRDGRLGTVDARHPGERCCIDL